MGSEETLKEKSGLPQEEGNNITLPQEQDTHKYAQICKNPQHRIK